MNIDNFIEKNYTHCPYFLVPRDIVDATYPKDYLTFDDLMLLLLIYSYRDQQHLKRHGKVTIGIKAFDSHIRPIRGRQDAKKRLEKLVVPLEKKGFIFPIHEPTLSLQYAMSLPPLYDTISKTPVQRFVGEVYSDINIINRKMPFIRVPKCLIDNNIITPRNTNYSLNINHISALLLCYRYNFLETFGGVDMKFIRKVNGKLTIKENVYMNLHIDTAEGKKEFKDTLIYLEKIGLIIWVDIVVKNNVFISDYNLFDPNNLTVQHKVIKIIRPVFQPLLMKENIKP